MQIIEQAKSHPYIAGGVVVGGLILAYMIVGGGGATGTDMGGSYDNVTAGTSLQQFQDQMTVQMAAIAADTAKTTSSNAAALEAARLETQSAFDIESLRTSLGFATIDASKEVSIAQIKASEMGATEETNRLRIQSDAATAQQASMLDVIRNQTNQQANVALQAQKPHTIWQFLFG